MVEAVARLANPVTSIKNATTAISILACMTCSISSFAGSAGTCLDPESSRRATHPREPRTNLFGNQPRTGSGRKKE
jgi:hypothetical protein